jgi:ABC-2 type transport system permease protein
MTAAVENPQIARRSHIELPDARLRFTGILRSEWIKLVTVRSTVWALIVLLLIQVGMGVMAALTISTPEPAVGGDVNAASFAVFVSTIGVFFNQLVIAVLGVLVVTGEYSTGQIRSTLTAVPTRVPVLIAKGLVFGVVAFVVSLVSVVIAYAATWPVLDPRVGQSSITDPDVWWPLLGAAGYLALVGLLSFSIGAIMRHTAAGIAVAVGLLLVVPIVLGLIGAEWTTVVNDWLPSTAGQTLIGTGDVFEPWQAVLVMLGWVAVPFVTASALLARRDA